MRICVLVTTTYRYDSRVRRTARTLQQEGHEVHVLCSYSRDVPDRYEIDEGVAVHRVVREARDTPGAILETVLRGRRPRSVGAAATSERRRRVGASSLRATALRALSSPVLLFLRLLTTVRFVQAARELAPDVVHTNDADTLPAAVWLSRSVRVHVHDAHELTSDRANQFWWERHLDLWWERRAIPRAAAVVSVSPAITQQMAQTHGRTVQTIRNIPLGGPNEVSPPFLLRDNLSIPRGHRIALYLGIRSPGRGLLDLIRAVADVPDVHVVLLGSSVRGFDDDLIALAISLNVTGRVHVLPPVDSRSLLAMSAQADVGICLIEPVSKSYELSLPNKLFEYLNAGLPVVATDLPEIRNVVSCCSGGVLCSPGSVFEIREALRQRLPAPIGEKVPSGEREMRRLADIYDNLTSASQPRR